MIMRAAAAAWVLCWAVLPASADESVVARVRALHESATAHYDLGEYDAAAADFKAAFLLRQDPAFLFDLAQCWRMLGRWSDAARSYRAYLREAPDAPNRPDVEARIAEMDARARLSLGVGHGIGNANGTGNANGVAAERPWWRDRLAPALAVPGLGLLGGGVGFLVWGHSLDGAAQAATSADERFHLSGRAATAAVIGYVALAVGAALCIAGAIRWAVRSRHSGGSGWALR